MRALARIVSVIALLFLTREWLLIRDDLARVYRARSSVSEHRPSALAQQLLISGEDHRFFRHGGIDPIAICRAMWRGLVLGQNEGASTIEMQVIRVVTGSFERTLRRKIRELAFATLVAREIPKQALPSLYLQNRLLRVADEWVRERMSSPRTEGRVIDTRSDRGACCAAQVSAT